MVLQVLLLRSFWLAFAAFLPVLTVGCLPCNARGKLSCASDGCVWSRVEERCGGVASCDDGNAFGAVNQNPDEPASLCTPGYCKGSPTLDPCADAVDPNSNDMFHLNELNCIQHSIKCNWDDEKEVCSTASDACTSILYEVEEFECRSFGCDWTPERCESRTTSDANNLRGHGGLVYLVSTISFLAAWIFSWY